MTTEDIYNHLRSQLQNIYDQREAENISDWIIENIAGIKRLDRITDKKKELPELTVSVLNAALLRLLQYEPVQYILNEAWFYKMKFCVNENVLIPRPETEELVEWVVKECKMKNEKFKIIEIGAGSGCIPISLKKELPNAEIFSVDVSDDALQVAKKNAAMHHTEIEFKRIDFLDESSWENLDFFDIIVSNPPYIPENEKQQLNKNVTTWEPHLALFTADNDPYIFYKKIALFSKEHLTLCGKIFVEIHEYLAKETAQIFSDHDLKTIIKKDIYGKERMICAYN